MNTDFNLYGNYGWICPKCGSVMSPSTSFCIFCHKPQISTVTVTGTSKGDTSIGGISDGTIQIRGLKNDL